MQILQCSYFRCQREFELGDHKNPRKYCSRSCSTSHRNSVWSIKKSWQRKYGDAWEARYEEWRTKMSEVTSGENNAMFGKSEHTHGLKRYARDKTGKSLEQIHGSEFAADIRQRTSQSLLGENNPAYGKVYPNAGRSIKGHYKGIFFRSLFEYSFLKHLERSGINLCEVKSESFRVPYAEGRTYIPDFYVPSQNTVYEVKPFSWSKNATVRAKCEAAASFFKECDIEFRMVTEHDFGKIQFDVAVKDPDVIWREKSFENFKR